jgi:ATP-dependent RNA helicase DDX27
VLTDTDIRAWKPKRDKFSGLSRQAKRRKLASEADTKEERRATDAAVRSAKKAARPTKIGIPKGPSPRRSTSKHKRKGDKLGKAGFSHDQGSKGSRSEGIRAKRGDVAKIKGKRRK